MGYTKNITKGLLVLFLFSIAISCTKDNNSSDDPVIPKTMDEMVIGNDFNWTAALKGKLNISFNNPNNVSTEKEIINIINNNDEIVKRAKITNGTVNFDITLPQNATYYIHFPVTGDKMPITTTGDIEMQLGTTIPDTVVNKSKTIKLDDITSCTTCDNPMVNAGAEFPAINSGFSITHQNNIPGWETTASDHRIEIWRSGFQGVPAQEGNQFFELNANMVADLFQELCLEPGSTIKWSVWHRGRSGVDVAEVKIGATVASAVALQVMTDGNNSWGYYSGSYTVPEDQETTFFVFSSVSSAGSASVGNFLDNFEIECDFDGDGVPDDEDDDPGNADVTYVSYFPTSGKQVVAFEDLWPSTGDFDFNDLTMSNKVKINKDNNFNLLSADFTISIDAIGADIHNGIGMMLYKENGDAFNDNIIATITGDAVLDEDNSNGIILTNDVFEAISEYYQNNGVGPTATPDTLKFTVTFNSNAEEFIPELYIFRSFDRSYEIHRSNFPATEAMDNTLFNTIDDKGNYKTENGLPWGLEIILEGDYKSPKERVDMLKAYPEFREWATSEGTQNTDWYLSPVEENVVDIFSKK
ncbi:MAG: LruC domain-containing protein [Bacteroidota bacterium]|nr:LruC domain-containing protein [Bacteroidota bacterium]